MVYRVKNPKNISSTFACSSEDVKKIDALCEYFEMNRSELLRMLVNLKHVEVERERNKKKAG